MASRPIDPVVFRSTRHPASRTRGSRRWRDREAATRRDSRLVPRRARPCRSGRPRPRRPARERRGTTRVGRRPSSTTVGAAPDRDNPRNRDPPATVAPHRPPCASADASRRRSTRSRRTTWRHRGRSGPTNPPSSHSYRARSPFATCGNLVPGPLLRAPPGLSSRVCVDRVTDRHHAGVSLADAPSPVELPQTRRRLRRPKTRVQAVRPTQYGPGHDIGRVRASRLRSADLTRHRPVPPRTTGAAAQRVGSCRLDVEHRAHPLDSRLSRRQMATTTV